MHRLWTLAVVWSAALATLLGCSDVADPLDARALRRHFPEQADAILQGPVAFTVAGDVFEAMRPADALAAPAGAAGLRARFPSDGADALRFPLPDGSEAQVRELGAAGDGEVAERAMAYPRAGGTSFWTALEDGYEEWLLLDPSAVRRDAPAAAWLVDGATLRQDGEAVEVADARGAAQLRVTAPEAYAAGGRPIGTRLVARGEQIELWLDAEGETALVDPRWKLKRRMSTRRAGSTATLLRDGRVLVAGGFGPDGPNASSEVFDPESDTWSPPTPMITGRFRHTATALNDGRVLVAGGVERSIHGPALSSAEVFDPVSGTWSQVRPMSTDRYAHTATRLLDGRVVVAGGVNVSDAADNDGPEDSGSPAPGERRTLDAVEVFDPVSGAWSALDPMPTARHAHSATLLRDGRVLAAGGYNDVNSLDAAEVFDPVSGAWSALDAMPGARSFHTATRLRDGRVLVIGGYGDTGLLGTADVFDPTGDSWSPIEATMAVARTEHSATRLRDGRVLVTGGNDGTGPVSTAEVFDPAEGSWKLTGPTVVARFQAAAVSLRDGRVLVAGGAGQQVGLDSAEVYDPASSTWLSADPMITARSHHSATPLRDGRVLVAGGMGETDSEEILRNAEVFDPVSSAWAPVASMSTARYGHIVASLPDGRLLVAGGARTWQEAETIENTTEVFDPASGAWQSAAPMKTARVGHRVTPLPDGRLIVTGGHGHDGPLDSSELFDPSSGEWRYLPHMASARYEHIAAALPDGRLLVAGGYGVEGSNGSSEVLDLASDTWLPFGRMVAGRGEGSVTPLPDGRLLVAGGFGLEGVLASVEALDPAFGTWLPLAPMPITRTAHTATPLAGGWVLVAGGASVLDVDPIQVDNAETFDPASGRWSPMESMHTPRYRHTATPLADGRILVAGGVGTGSTVQRAAELFQQMPDGSACATAAECRSGFCADGVCCDRPCTIYLCEACADHRGASADGVCTPLHPDYPPYACSPGTGQQMRPCKSVQSCVEGFVCNEAGDCVPPPPNGGYLDAGGCRLAPRAAAQPGARGPLEVGALALAVLAAALRRRRRIQAPPARRAAPARPVTARDPGARGPALRSS
ncbi:Kelch repeat-containing protein [Sorangium sp. So ce131]|uniref:Kelch repeat-containing protein n=1 Tax=Sorangium sp. So ce131 TaxID=3133282 RepID=UPI003F607658